MRTGSPFVTAGGEFRGRSRDGGRSIDPLIPIQPGPVARGNLLHNLPDEQISCRMKATGWRRNSGQGGAQAIEDGTSLGALFPLGTDASEIPARLQLYQRCRKARAEYVQDVSRQSGKDVQSGSKDNVVKIMKFFDYNCGHDEFHHSTHQLRNWMFRKRANCYYWRMPISFGPFPGPRQSAQGQLQIQTRTDHSTTSVTRSIRFKTSRTLLQNLFPSPAYSFISPATVAEASYVQTTLDKTDDWLGGGRGYDYFGFYLHGVQYTKRDGSDVRGDYLAVMWENLTDPILSGREEVGFPKLFCDIDVDTTPSKWSMKASWRGANFISLEMNELGSTGEEPLDAEPSSHADGVLLHKYVPVTGKPGCADAEYAVLVPSSSSLNEQKTTNLRLRRTRDCTISINARDEKTLPTLNHIASRLAEIPVFEIVEGTVVEGSGGVGHSSWRSAYRVE